MCAVSSARARFRLVSLRTLGASMHPRPLERLRPDPRILVIRPDHIGDVLLTTPALDVLQRAFPRGHIAALVGPWSAEIIRRGPPIHAMRTFSFPGFTRQRSGWLAGAYVKLICGARDLRRQRFDVAVIARPDHWWGAMLAAMAGIPHRVGFDVPECMPFLTEVLEQPPRAHTAELSLILARRVCELADRDPPPHDSRPMFRVSDAERASARAAISAGDLGTAGPLVVLHPGAGTKLKLWPAERWASALDLIHDRWNARTLVVSSSTDAPLVGSILARARAKHPSLTTDQGLGHLAAILEQADVVIGSDSGPLHLATAVGTDTVRIYGPTDPALFGPWPLSDGQVVLRPVVPCSPCGYVTEPPCGDPVDPRCMLEQTPEDVSISVGWLLGKSKRVTAMVV
jgi:heptosyltransferase III